MNMKYSSMSRKSPTDAAFALRMWMQRSTQKATGSCSVSVD